MAVQRKKECGLIRTYHSHPIKRRCGRTESMPACQYMPVRLSNTTTIYQGRGWI